MENIATTEQYLATFFIMLILLLIAIIVFGKKPKKYKPLVSEEKYKYYEDIQRQCDEITEYFGVNTMELALAKINKLLKDNEKLKLEYEETLKQIDKLNNKSNGRQD